MIRLEGLLRTLCPEAMMMMMITTKMYDTSKPDKQGVDACGC